MKPALLWAPQAKEDLLEIYVIIGLDKPSAADRFLTAIEEKATSLISQPRLGVRRPEIAPEARMLTHGSYVILYQTRPDSENGPVDSIEIVRIVHGHRDMARVF